MTHAYRKGDRLAPKRMHKGTCCVSVTGMTQPILHSAIPYEIRHSLPGTQPVQNDDWLWVDEMYAPQMAYRDWLIADRPDVVHRMGTGSEGAARELLSMSLDKLLKRNDFSVSKGQVVRPDGVAVPIDLDQPLVTLGRIAQADYCILQRPEGAEEHLLTAAILCFPSSWMLAEKAGRPLTGIHIPVPQYDDNIARRVQRLFDGVQAGRPLWRSNSLWHGVPDLHQPKSESLPRRSYGPDAPYFRSERQVIMRLPETRAVVFSIHTFVTCNPAAASA